MSRFNKHIIIVGSARSGTSWLAELMARPFRYRLLFEPEHEFQTPKGHLLCDRWIQNKDMAGEGNAYLKQVFANRVDNDWIAQHSNRKWKRHLWPLIPKRFIIKFVRCNLAARYMCETFGIPVIHLIRDPYEVVDSQQRVKFPWLYDLSRFQAQEPLVKFILETYQFDIRETNHFNDDEILALRWCIENCVPLMQESNPELPYYKVYYDTLRGHMEAFLALCQTVNVDYVPGLEKRYAKPSSKSHPRGWKQETPYIPLKTDQIPIKHILEAFKYQKILENRS